MVLDGGINDHILFIYIIYINKMCICDIDLIRIST